MADELTFAILGIKYSLIAMALSIAGNIMAISFDLMRGEKAKMILRGVSVILLTNFALILLYYASKIQI